MKYTNEHKELINKVKAEKPLLVKWQARVIANRLIGDILLKDKNLKAKIVEKIKASEFEALVQIKVLKNKVAQARKA